MLQLGTYAHVLESYLDRLFAADDTPDARFLDELRAEYQVTAAEHLAVLDKLVGGTGTAAPQLIEELKVIERTSHTIEVFASETTPAYRFLTALMRRRRERAIDRVLHRLGITAEDDHRRRVRAGLGADERARRAAAVEDLCAHLSPAAERQLLEVYRATAGEEAALTSAVDILRVRALSIDPYVRAAALYLLGELGGVDSATLTQVQQDEHDVVRDVCLALQQKQQVTAGPAALRPQLTMIEKMFALGEVPMFSQITLEGIAELAQASADVEYAPGQAICEQDETGAEVFIVLAGEVLIARGRGVDEHIINVVGAGGLIGEMAVLDPAPRSATARAGARGVRVLRLNGDAFRDVLNANPSIASGIIRTLARRLRGTMDSQHAVIAS
jgi:hypothetical protein